MSGPYSHTDYDPFWAAASDLNMPLSLHILTGRKGMGIDFFADNLALQVSTLHHEVERSIAVFVLGGVLERFPKLTIVSAENDVAWMPYFMWRMDFAHRRIGPALFGRVEHEAERLREASGVCDLH